MRVDISFYVGPFLMGALVIMATSMIYLPVENFSAPQLDNETVIEVSAIDNLIVSNIGLNSITLNWPNSSKKADIAFFNIYVDQTLIDIIDASSNTYTITRLSPGKWYHFHVDACNISNNCSNGGIIAGVRTLTVTEATWAIIRKVDNLTSSGILNSAQGESLIRSLVAIYQLDNTNPKPIINQLQFFIGNINSLIADGVLKQESGQPLIDATDDVIRNLNGETNAAI